MKVAGANKVHTFMKNDRNPSDSITVLTFSLMVYFDVTYNHVTSISHSHLVML